MSSTASSTAFTTFVENVGKAVNSPLTLQNWWVDRQNALLGNNYISLGFTYVRGMSDFKIACLNDGACDYQRFSGYDGMIFAVVWSLGSTAMTGFAAASTFTNLLCFPNPIATRNSDVLGSTNAPPDSFGT